MLSDSRKKEIQELARTTLNESYCALESEGSTPHLFLRSRLKDIVKGHVGLSLVEVPTIQIRESASKAVWVGGEIAGMLERDEQRITIATNHPLTSQRFTLAHELGHWFLHTGTVFFRERPMFDTAFAKSNKPRVECEADTYAAEFLMPRKLVTTNFRETFGDPICLSDVRPEHLHSLSSFVFPPFKFSYFKQAGMRVLSQTLAELRVIGAATEVQPLHSKFGVSSEAMAIRLEELGLVRS